VVKAIAIEPGYRLLRRVRQRWCIHLVWKAIVRRWAESSTWIAWTILQTLIHPKIYRFVLTLIRILLLLVVIHFIICVTNIHPLSLAVEAILLLARKGSNWLASCYLINCTLEWASAAVLDICQCMYQEPHSYQATSSNSIRSKSRSNEHHGLRRCGNLKSRILKQRYLIKDLGELKWFLGVWILRDRTQRKLWLCQDSYIEKIPNQFSLTTAEGRAPSIPLATNELLPNTGNATPNDIRLFQCKVGSISYATTITQPDVARAASKLSEFLLNSSEKHQQAANQAIQYLYATRHLAIEYNGESTLEINISEPTDQSRQFIVASDASFADNSNDRKSTQGMLMTLFGGPIAWKSGKRQEERSLCEPCAHIYVTR